MIGAPVMVLPELLMEENMGRTFLSSGCTLLNLAATEHPKRCFEFGLVHNLLGSESTGKSLLATIACINTNIVMEHLERPFITVYDDVECAFSEDFAARLCEDYINTMDVVDKVEQFKAVEKLPKNILTRSYTIEEFYYKLKNLAEGSNGDYYITYILDSYDALSTALDSADDVDKGSYGTAKTKQLSTLFRHIVKLCNKANILLIITSQLRASLGGNPFSKSTTTTGGFALRHYTSLRIALTKGEKLSRKAHGKDTPYAMAIEFYIEKNRLGKPLRRGHMYINFYSGIDDMYNNLQYLLNVGKIKKDKQGRIEWGDKRLYLADLAKYLRMQKAHKEVIDMVVEAYKQEEAKLEEKTAFAFVDDLKEILLQIDMEE